VSAGGFKKSFHEVAEEIPQTVVAWDLSDILP
jgi:hypothetical protein